MLTIEVKMGLLKNAGVGFADGMGTGVYLPGYIAKRISGKDFYSHGYAIDSGELTDKDVNRKSLEYQIMKGVGDVLGVACGITTLYLIGILYDVKKNRGLKRASNSFISTPAQA